MSLLFIPFAHLLVTLARLAGPGGIHAVAAESLAIKHQLIIMARSRRRSPNLTPRDRVILGFCTLLVSPRRLGRIVILKTSTLLRFHRALVKRRYRVLFSSGSRRRPGPKGPLIDAVVETKRRNPYFGCRNIAAQIFSAFGIALNKDVVRRILVRHYPAGPEGGGPSWLAAIGHARDPLWRVDLFRQSILLKSYWILVVLDADEIKTIPGTPRSHAFVERLIGTTRRDYLDRIWFLEPDRSPAEARRLQGVLQPI